MALEELRAKTKIKESELDVLRDEYNQEIEKEKKMTLKRKSVGIKKSLYLLGFEFVSSSSRTPQYREFHRVFKRELKAILDPYTQEILIHKPNHFDVSGFFKTNEGKIHYFSLGDLRGDKDDILIRTAESFEDYTGGSNGYIRLDDDFESNLIKYIRE